MLKSKEKELNSKEAELKSREAQNTTGTSKAYQNK